MGDLVIFNVLDERFISISNQVRILHGSHEDSWMLGINTDFVKVSWTNSDLGFASSYFYSIPIPSSKMQLILIELNLQYLTNGLTSLVKIKGELVSPNGKAVKTENFSYLWIPRKNRQASDEIQKYQYGDNRPLD